MSSFNLNALNFSEVVQSYFLERTGKGLIFSSRDLDLLMKWENTGSSPATICKGIDMAVERARKTPRDLFSCKSYVEETIGKSSPLTKTKPTKTKPTKNKPTKNKISTQSHVEESSLNPIKENENALQILKHAEKQSSYTYFESLYRHAIQTLESEKELDLFLFEKTFFNNAFSALPESEKQRIDIEIKTRLHSVLRTMSEKAKNGTLAAKRRTVLEKMLGFSRLQQ